jgi:hypothetical protein
MMPQLLALAGRPGLRRKWLMWFDKYGCGSEAIPVEDRSVSRSARNWKFESSSLQRRVTREPVNHPVGNLWVWWGHPFV